jgi:hypothetical protein
MSDVKFTVSQTAPTDNGAITTPTGGSWGASTYNFKVVAWYADDETQVDNAGVDRGVIAAWESIVVAANDSVVIPVAVDTTRAFTFAVYWQGGASFDETLNAARIDDGEITLSQTSATEWTLTVDSEATSVNLILGAAAAELELSPPAPISAIFRDAFNRAYTGELVKESFLDSRVLESLTIDANTVLAISGNGTLEMLQRWMKDQVRLKIEDTHASSTSYFTEMYGVIGNISQFATRTDLATTQIFCPIDSEVVA